MVRLLLSRMARQPIAARQGCSGRCAASWARAAWSGRSTGCTGWRCGAGLGEVPPLVARPEADSDVAEWLETDVLALAVYTAFLSRMVADDLEDESAAGAGTRA
jgi:hypothetical protein